MINIKKTVAVAIGAAMTVMTVCASAFFGTAQVNREKYPVFGVDVSNYQGVIDWELIDNQNVDFAFIKATEGSGYVDRFVSRNLENIAETDILCSCYHFFSFDSAGETQAENFIKTVGKDKIQLPPVVDIEYYGDKSSNKPTREETEKILEPLLRELEEYYGVKPIIYTTMPVYYRYVKENFSDYPLWIRCTQFEPEHLEWQFWQYSDKGKLEGYYGSEPCIDFNVFRGTKEELEAMTFEKD